MTAKDKATAFLDAMKKGAPAVKRAAPVEPPAAPAVPAPTTIPPSVARRKTQKHIAAYFDRETTEKLVLLRVRLGLDNSAILKMAVEELYRKHETKTAFGDA